MIQQSGEQKVYFVEKDKDKVMHTIRFKLLIRLFAFFVGIITFVDTQTFLFAQNTKGAQSITNQQSGRPDRSLNIYGYSRMFFINYERVEGHDGFVIGGGGGEYDGYRAYREAFVAYMGYRYHFKPKLGGVFIGFTPTLLYIGTQPNQGQFTSRELVLGSTVDVGIRWIFATDINLVLRVGMGPAYYSPIYRYSGEWEVFPEEGRFGLTSTGEISIGYAF